MVNFRRLEYGDRVSIGGFDGEGLYYGEIKQENFWIALLRSQDSLAARTMFRTGEFLFSGVDMEERSEIT